MNFHGELEETPTISYWRRENILKICVSDNIHVRIIKITESRQSYFLPGLCTSIFTKFTFKNQHSNTLDHNTSLFSCADVLLHRHKIWKNTKEHRDKTYLKKFLDHLFLHCIEIKNTQANTYWRETLLTEKMCIFI